MNGKSVLGWPFCIFFLFYNCFILNDVTPLYLIYVGLKMSKIN